ncbi:hypothetical protein ACTTAI_04600 [Rhodobacter capsulatus]|uniref:hypothetical protein n=1 Tax=Rhodobacter capsulatus TaxID=1061 RepID=UPI004027A980
MRILRSLGLAVPRAGLREALRAGLGVLAALAGLSLVPLLAPQDLRQVSWLLPPFASLRVDAAAAYAPEASMRVKVARDVDGLDAKLASVAAELPGSFYDLKIAAGMATRVNTDSLAE